MLDWEEIAADIDVRQRLLPAPAIGIEAGNMKMQNSADHRATR